MNKERLLALADRIENLDGELGFNMAHWYDENSGLDDMSGHDCGTVACIAGHAVDMFGEKGWLRNAYRYHSLVISVSENARRLLDLERQISDELFGENVVTGMELWGIRPLTAAKVIRHLIETGEVRWDKFITEEDLS